MGLKFIVKFNCTNAAFGDDECTREEEVARILQVVANRAASGSTDFAVKDINGNKVGSAYYCD